MADPVAACEKAGVTLPESKNITNNILWPLFEYLLYKKY